MEKSFVVGLSHYLSELVQAAHNQQKGKSINQNKD